MNDGWRCPGCGRCYSPFMYMCSHCGPQAVLTGTGTGTAPLCNHDYGVPTTAGRICRKCGHNEGLNP